MKRIHPWHVVPLLAAAVWMAGCSQSSDPLEADSTDDISGANSMQAIDLDENYGGLAFSDEAEGFGDAQLVSEAQRESDDLLTGAALDTIGGDRAGWLQPIWLKIEWGRLDGLPIGDPARDAAVFDPVDWSGTASVDTGLVNLTRTLWFEYPMDHRLPRTSRRSFGWVSQTGPHKDGILLCILTPRATLGAVEGHLTFTTGPLTQTFSFAELRAGVDLLVGTSIEGNSVSFVSAAGRPERCPGGFLAGYWRMRAGDEHDGGWFRSRVIDQSGHLVGFLAGRFGVNTAGAHVFAGKLIGPGGQVRGLAAGHYELADDGSGTFEGRWVNREGRRLGLLKGRFLTREDGSGHMHGIWAQDCRS